MHYPASQHIGARCLALALILLSFLMPRMGLLADERSTEGDAAKRHAEEVESWREQRLETLRQPDSWLTLVGLFWLEQGENKAGSDIENKVVFPDQTPTRLGAFHLSGTKVEFVPTRGSKVHHGDRAVVGPIVLQADSQGEATVLELESVTFYIIERGGRYGVRIKDRENAAYRDFTGLDYFPIHQSWRLEARFESYDPPRPLAVPSILGTVSPIDSPGAVVFQIAGRQRRLEALPGGDENEIWLIFGDGTNGDETYGGGRFLYARLVGEDRAIVDFNKAYSPPCVFTPYATCPLPPNENKLRVKIEAGEKTYGEH